MLRDLEKFESTRELPAKEQNEQNETGSLVFDIAKSAKKKNASVGGAKSGDTNQSQPKTENRGEFSENISNDDLNEEAQKELGASLSVRNKMSRFQENERIVNDIRYRMRFMSEKDKKRAEIDLTKAERLKKIGMKNVLNDVFTLPAVMEFAVGVTGNDYDIFMEYKNIGEKNRSKYIKKNPEARQKISGAISFYENLAAKLNVSEYRAMQIAEEIMLQRKKGVDAPPNDESDGVVTWRAPEEEWPRENLTELPGTASSGEKNESYIPFDPKEEILKIGRFSEEELATTTQEQRVAIKKERLKRYNEQLIEQKLGIAETNAEIEFKILNEKEINKDALLECVTNAAKKYRLSDPQIEEYKEAITG